jgi:hypothetical protein
MTLTQLSTTSIQLNYITSLPLVINWIFIILTLDLLG